MVLSLQATGYQGAAGSKLKLHVSQRAPAAIFAYLAQSEAILLEPISGVPTTITIAAAVAPQRRSPTLSVPRTRPSHPTRQVVSCLEQDDLAHVSERGSVW
jgi:hypothetical protein